MSVIDSVLAVGEGLAGENEAMVGQNHTTINRHYPAYDGAPYCGLLVKYCAEMAGSHVLDGCPGIAGVGNFVSFAEARGWGVSSPQRGDIFVVSPAEHMGYVDEVLSGGDILRLEGNWGHVYATKSAAKSWSGASYEGIGYYRSSTSGLKFYRPPWDSSSSSGGGSSTPAAPAKTMPTQTEAVKDWQEWLGVPANGEYDSNTREAAIGRMLLGMLAKYPLKQGAKGDAVKVLQGRLLSLGYDPRGDDPDGIDGEYGGNTAGAVRSYQADSDGLTVDGEAGRDTVAALFGL